MSIMSGSRLGPTPSILSSDVSLSGEGLHETFNHGAVGAVTTAQEEEIRKFTRASAVATSRGTNVNAPAAVQVLKSGDGHLANKQFNLAYDAFKQALHLLKAAPQTSATVRPSLIAAYLGMNDALVQAACAKQKNRDKALAHLASAKVYVERATGLARMSQDPLHILAVELDFLVIAVMEAEIAAAAEPGRRIDADHAACLLDQVDDYLATLDGQAGGAGRDVELLRRKATVWRDRLKTRHCGARELEPNGMAELRLAELNGSDGRGTSELQ